MSTIVLMAGGSGGHLFPAMALAEELRRRGHVIHLMTDKRVGAYGEDFPAREVHIIPAATPSVRSPIRMLGAALTIARGTAIAFSMLGKIRGDVAVAFGGYPSVPPFLAARLRGIPGILHEQNAVIGRANRFLARFAYLLALNFEETKGAELLKIGRVVTGNPVRDKVRELSRTATYKAPTANGPIRLLVTGGSQGARAFSDIIPAAIAEIPDLFRNRLTITQQCRPDDLDRVARAYRELKINVELAAFFDDLPARIASSHLVISRAGASTVTELASLGVPAILIPLPGALDADQSANAAVIAAAGGGWLIYEDKVSPHSLAKRLTEFFREPELLASAAERIRALGEPDAVEGLADLVEKVAQSGRS